MKSGDYVIFDDPCSWRTSVANERPTHKIVEVTATHTETPTLEELGVFNNGNVTKLKVTLRRIQDWELR